MSFLIATSIVVLAVLAAVAFGPSVVERVRRMIPRRENRERIPAYDPGRERRAEARARKLLRSVVSADEYAMYTELGFLAVDGSEGDGGYGYLLYPHRPIVAFDVHTSELLNEYCVGFPDRSEPQVSQRLPDADDVLAKWMSLRAGERELISVANMHVPGRQLDPGQVARDLIRLREWRARRVGAAA